MDELDYAQEKIEAKIEEAIKAASINASKIPEGNSGDCEICGYWSGRLVVGACAPCRDRYGL